MEQMLLSINADAFQAGDVEGYDAIAFWMPGNGCRSFGGR